MGKNIKKSESDEDENDLPIQISHLNKTAADHQVDVNHSHTLKDNMDAIGKLSILKDTIMEPELFAKLGGGQAKIKPFQLELLIRNQILFINPSIEDARCYLISQLADLSSVVNQKRIKHTIISEDESDYSKTYKNLLNKNMNGLKLTEYAFVTIESLLKKVKEFVDSLVNLQSLWDLKPERLYSRLGDSLNAWIGCLNEIKELRNKSFDTQEMNRKFGPIIINYNKVISN